MDAGQIGRIADLHSFAARRVRNQGCSECIQAMDGNLSLVQAPDLSDEVNQSLPSLDAGFWHPCQNDGSTTYT
jgi:divalent metal cation (Fe/Co/Zn/Cd) transporter